MTRRAATAIATVLSLATLVAQQTQRPPVFRGGAVLVTVDVYPRRDGRIVEGLTAADFEVFEDGTPQKLDNVEFVRVEPSLSESERRDPNTQAESLELAADPHNRVFVAFLDRLHVEVEGSYAIRRPLVDLLNRVVAPNDLFGVTTQNLEPRHLVLGRRLISVDEQLTRYWPWGERNSITPDSSDPAEVFLRGCFEYRRGGGRWLVDDDGLERVLSDVLIDRRREDRTLTSLDDLISHLTTLREARTVLLLISDGWLLFGRSEALANEAARWTQPAPAVTIDQSGKLGTITKMDGSGDRTACNAELVRLAQMDSPQRLRDLMVRANRANVGIYPVAPTGLAAFDTPIREMPDKAAVRYLEREGRRMRNRVEGLRTLAENTDGVAIVNTNDLAGGMRRIADDVSAYYLLGYYSTNTRNDGRYRRIEVRLKPPDLTTQARRGYFAPIETPSRPAGPPPATAAVSPAIEAAFGTLSRLRPAAKLFTYGVVSGTDLAIAVELASSQLYDGQWTQGADVYVTVSSGAGEDAKKFSGRIEPSTRGILVRVPIESSSPAGSWKIEARATAGADAIEDRLELRSAPRGLVGEPLVFRATPAATSPLRPVADFQFRRTERVHVEWPAPGTIDRREARLLGRNGRPLPVPVAVTEREVDGRRSIAADLNLAPLSAGDYVIELTVGSGGQTETKLLAIRVVP
jgi:VWFA-related protein